MSKKTRPVAIPMQTSLSSNLDEIVASVGQPRSKWEEVEFSNLGAVPNQAGVYCFVLPTAHLPKERTVILHGRTSGQEGARQQLQFTFQYRTTPFHNVEGAVIYVGKACDLRARLKNHRSVSTSATTNQVLRGLTGRTSHVVTQKDLKNAKKVLQTHGKVFYHVHEHKDERQEPTQDKRVRQSYVADRDLLEIKLIAKFAPPFNIKAER